MLEGVPGGEQNFRWVLRLLCVLGALALYSAIVWPAHLQRRGGRAAEFVVPNCHTTHIYGLSDRRSGPHGPQRQSMNPPPGLDPCCSEHECPPSPASRSQGPWPGSPCLGLETGNPGPLRALVHMCVCVRERQTASEIRV